MSITWNAVLMRPFQQRERGFIFFLSLTSAGVGADEALAHLISKPWADGNSDAVNDGLGDILGLLGNQLVILPHASLALLLLPLLVLADPLKLLRKRVDCQSSSNPDRATTMSTNERSAYDFDELFNAEAARLVDGS